MNQFTFYQYFPPNKRALPNKACNLAKCGKELYNKGKALLKMDLGYDVCVYLCAVVLYYYVLSFPCIF